MTHDMEEYEEAVKKRKIWAIGITIGWMALGIVTMIVTFADSSWIAENYPETIGMSHEEYDAFIYTIATPYNVSLGILTIVGGTFFIMMWIFWILFWVGKSRINKMMLEKEAQKKE